MALLYLANDVLQRSRKTTTVFLEGFGKRLPTSLHKVYNNGSSKTKSGIERILTIWAGRGIFSSDYIAKISATIRDKKKPKGASVTKSKKRDMGKTANATQKLVQNFQKAKQASPLPQQLPVLHSAHPVVLSLVALEKATVMDIVAAVRCEIVPDGQPPPYLVEEQAQALDLHEARLDAQIKRRTELIELLTECATRQRLLLSQAITARERCRAQRVDVVGSAQQRWEAGPREAERGAPIDENRAPESSHYTEHFAESWPKRRKGELLAPSTHIKQEMTEHIHSQDHGEGPPQPGRFADLEHGQQQHLYALGRHG